MTTKEVKVKLTKKEVKENLYKEASDYMFGVRGSSGKLLKCVFEKLDIMDDFFEYLKTKTVSDYKVNEIYKALLELQSKILVLSTWLKTSHESNNQLLGLEVALLKAFEGDEIADFYKEMEKEKMYKKYMGRLIDEIIN